LTSKLLAVQLRIQEQNTLIATTAQFTSAKAVCAYVSSNNSSRVQMVSDWNGAHPVCHVDAWWTTKELRMRIK